VLAVPVLRPLRALQVVIALARVNRRAAVSFRGRTTLYVVAAVLLLGFVAALAVLDAERGRPGANIDTFGDALWWAATTITTVGYGDLFPVTAEGRIVGVGLMLGGITLAGVVTASLASWFIEHFAAAEEAEERTRDEIAELAGEVRALRALLERDGGPPA
jgi:voltage-gated potassium channel